MARIGWKRAAVAVGVVALGGAGTALATGELGIPDADGVIHGCYQNQQGMLRVVVSEDECHASELALRWNEQGPQGEPGAKGDTGATGLQGEKGDTGATGPKGDKGDTGDRGDQGVQGVQGLKGEVGPKGDPGPAGPAGAKGDDGSPGLSGYQIVVADTEVSSERRRILTAECPTGKRAIGGGAAAITHVPLGGTSESGHLTVVVDNPNVDGISWQGVASEVGDGTSDQWRLRVRVICAAVGG